MCFLHHVALKRVPIHVFQKCRRSPFSGSKDFVKWCARHLQVEGMTAPYVVAAVRLRLHDAYHLKQT